MPDAGTTPPHAILTDIEGTTTPIAFVHDVLFPYARARLPEFLATSGHDPEVASLCEEICRLVPGQPPATTLRDWMDRDEKVTPLKTIQGMIWRQGYEAGQIVGVLYPDVAPALDRFRAEDIRLYVYSSGSVAAQRLLFGHSNSGNVLDRFAGFHDTGTGPKRASGSYATIAARHSIAARHWLFLSDSAAELDAARQAGFATCQMLRAEDETVPAPNHPHCTNFAEIFRLWS